MSVEEVKKKRTYKVKVKDSTQKIDIASYGAPEFKHKSFPEPMPEAQAAAMKTHLEFTQPYRDIMERINPHLKRIEDLEYALYCAYRLHNLDRIDSFGDTRLVRWFLGQQEKHCSE